MLILLRVWTVKYITKFMMTIDLVLFPFALFIFYYGIALWCLHQPLAPASASTALIIEAPASAFTAFTMEVSDVSSTNSEFKLIPQTGFNISQKWLETQLHKNLKAIASELSIEVIGDRRFKNNYINVILDRGY